ncbi:MAG: flavin reductase family protein [Actinobacteria bacterium]|nr:flavin reductase family protein [Actinomycetota bacterium]
MLVYAEKKGWLDDAGRVAAHVEWEFIIPIEPEAFRHVLGHFPTGVTVLTAWERGTPIGMTCNSFTSVSLDPPLIAVCPAKSSQTWPKIRDAGRFILHLMPVAHEEMAQKFAQRDADRFVSVSHRATVAGPALDDALAWIYCSVVDEHDAGDHTIVVAEVVRLEGGGGGPQPLVFYRGNYGTFVPSTEPHAPDGPRVR